MFKVGDKVKAPAFVDCFGHEHPEVIDLTVEKVNDVPAIAGAGGEGYQRIKAVKPDGYCYIEGAASFFVVAH